MGATLLLADDSITIQRVIELTFADEDIRVVVASDGQQAIQKIDAEQPDIVLADIGMPRVDGYAVATHVKENASLKHIPVLLLTGAFEPIDEARARRTGCDGVLVKPFEPQKLVARVKELLGGARGAQMWPAEMPRAQVERVEPVEPAAPVLAEPVVRSMPELLREEQFEVAAPPLSMPSAPNTPSAGTAPSEIEIERVLDIDPALDAVFDLGEPAVPPAEPAEALEGDDVANRNGDHVPRHARPELPPPADRLETELDMLDAALSRLDPTANPHELDEETASEFARDLNEMRNEARHEDTLAPRPAARPSFGSWDLPKPANGDIADERPIDIFAEEIPLRPVSQVAPPVVQAPPAVVQAPPPVVQAAPPVVQTAPPVVQAPPPVVHVAPQIVQAPPPVVQPAVVPPPPVVHVPVVAAPAPPAPAAPAQPAAPVKQAPLERPTLASAFSALLAAEKSVPTAHAAAPQISEAAIEEVVKRVLTRMAGDTVNRVVLETAERMIREEISRTKDPSGR